MTTATLTTRPSTQPVRHLTRSLVLVIVGLALLAVAFVGGRATGSGSGVHIVRVIPAPAPLTGYGAADCRSGVHFC